MNRAKDGNREIALERSIRRGYYAGETIRLQPVPPEGQGGGRPAMNPFTFQTTPNVLFEAGAARKIAGLVSEFGARRVLFVTDKGVRGAGLTRNAEASLAAGCDLTVSRTWAPTRP